MTLNRVQYDFAHKRKLYTFLEIKEKKGKLTCHDDRVYWDLYKAGLLSKTGLVRVVRIITNQ